MSFTLKILEYTPKQNTIIMREESNVQAADLKPTMREPVEML